MSGTKTMIACAVAIMVSVSALTYADKLTGARYPAHYRSWAVVKGRLVGPNNPGFATGGGFRYIYANRTGKEGYANLPFEDGAVLVDERVHATENANGVFQEGATLHVDVMVKDSEQCAETGGWCFNFFTGEDTTVGITPTAQKACFAQCHARTPQTDFVFSQFRRP
jgi:hypothetical protein